MDREPPSRPGTMNRAEQRVLGEWFHEYGNRAKLTCKRFTGGMADRRDVRRHCDDRGAGHRLREAPYCQSRGPVGCGNVCQYHVGPVLEAGCRGKIGGADRSVAGHLQPLHDEGLDQAVRLQHQDARVLRQGTHRGGEGLVRFAHSGAFRLPCVTAGFPPGDECYVRNTCPFPRWQVL